MPHQLTGYTPEVATGGFSALSGVIFLATGAACNLQLAARFLAIND